MTSIFSKLSRQSKHRDLWEELEETPSPYTSNVKSAKTIADLYAMGISLRMVCHQCSTKGPLDISALPLGVHTETRLIGARCPTCNSESVSQDVVTSTNIPGPAFLGILRQPKPTKHKPSPRARTISDPSPTFHSMEDDDLLDLWEDDIIPDLLLTDEESGKDDLVNKNQSTSRKPQVKTNKKTCSSHRTKRR